MKAVVLPNPGQSQHDGVYQTETSAYTAQNQKDPFTSGLAGTFGDHSNGWNESTGKDRLFSNSLPQLSEPAETTLLYLDAPGELSNKAGKQRKEERDTDKIYHNILTLIQGKTPASTKQRSVEEIFR